MKPTEKIRSLSRVTPRQGLDSVAQAKAMGERRAFDVLMQANQCWCAMDRFRRERERCRRYTYGDQWGDLIRADGKTTTEEDYIRAQGNVPLKNNLIRRLVNVILGTYRSQQNEPVCVARDRDEQSIGETMTTVLQYNSQLNQLSELNARSMEEFLISGLVVYRKSYGWRRGKLDCWTDYVSPNMFFVDTSMRDFRGWDISIIGEVHDISFGELCQRYAHKAEDVQRLKQIYAYAHNRSYVANYTDSFGYSRLSSYDFLLSEDNSLCRVIEVWRKEQKPRYRCHDYNSGELYKIEVSDYQKEVEDINADRIARGTAAGMAPEDIPLVKAEWMMDDYWYYYHLSPFGDILEEGETPYDHEDHPYVFKAYPYIDGEIHSFVADVIDQQRYTNRLITMYDWIMRASAKGLLMFPQDALPDGYSMEDIADEWSRFNGMIVYKAKPGVPAPHQIANNCTNVGITELLGLQMKIMEDISGVNGALQGKAAFSGESAAHLNAQIQNAQTSLMDVMQTFSAFVVDGAYKTVKLIQQYYDDRRVSFIAGRRGKRVVYDPAKVRDVEFDLAITESTNTPAYRQMANQILMQLFTAQAITVEDLLQHGDFPFADDLLQSLQSKKQELEHAQSQQEQPSQP